MGSGPKYMVLADQIQQEIAEGVYEEGDYLPPEADLARARGVSRPTVSHALTVLKKRGLVGATKGVGTWVCAPDKGRLDRRGRIALDTVEAESGYVVDVIRDADRDGVDVLRRRFLRRQDGQPTEIITWNLTGVMADSWRLSRTTPLTMSFRHYVESTYDKVASHATDSTVARRATQGERLLLSLKDSWVMATDVTVVQLDGRRLYTAELLSPPSNPVACTYPLL